MWIVWLVACVTLFGRSNWLVSMCWLVCLFLFLLVGLGKFFPYFLLIVSWWMNLIWYYLFFCYNDEMVPFNNKSNVTTPKKRAIDKIWWLLQERKIIKTNAIPTTWGKYLQPNKIRHQTNHITSDDWVQSHKRDKSAHNAKEYIILAMLENTLTHIKQYTIGNLMHMQKIQISMQCNI